MTALTPVQRLDQFARALSADTGLSYDASYLWAKAEVGANNNLGIMVGARPAAYPTPAAGAAAAAALIDSSPLYAGIRASTSGSTHAQLTAIAQSPWHLGPTGLSRVGGTDPYYAKVFGLTLGSKAAPSTNKTPRATATPAPGIGVGVSGQATSGQGAASVIVVPSVMVGGVPSSASSGGTAAQSVSGTPAAVPTGSPLAAVAAIGVLFLIVLTVKLRGMTA